MFYHIISTKRTQWKPYPIYTFTAQYTPIAMHHTCKLYTKHSPQHMYEARYICICRDYYHISINISTNSTH